MKTPPSDKKNKLLFKAIGRILTALSLRSVAWRGDRGKAYYRSHKFHSKSLASLASLARGEAELCRLAAGWKQVRDSLLASSPQYESGEDQSLVIVIENFSTSILTVLEELQQSRLNASVLLADPDNIFWQSEAVRIFPSPDLPSGSESASEGIDYEGWREIINSECDLEGRIYNYAGILAKNKGIFYPFPVSITDLDKACRLFGLLNKRPGIKIFHLVPSYHTVRDEAKELPRLTENTEPDPFACQAFAKNKLISPRLQQPTLEQAVLPRLARDLQSLELTCCIWAARHEPGLFKLLRSRLQIASVSSALTQAAGAAAAGTHPLVVISAIDLPLILNEMFDRLNFPVTILLTEAGLKSYNGRIPSINLHDLSVLRNLKHLTIGVPADEEEARRMLKTLLSLQGPGLLRLSCSPAVGLPACKEPQPFGELTGDCLQKGSDLSMVCLGSSVYHAVLASQTLKTWGLDIGIYNMRWLNPLDTGLMREIVNSRRIITVEEHAKFGALGSAAAEYLTDNGLNDIKIKSLGLREDISSSDLEAHGISASELVKAAQALLEI